MSIFIVFFKCHEMLSGVTCSWNTFLSTEKYESYWKLFQILCEWHGMKIMSSGSILWRLPFPSSDEDEN